MDAFSFYRHVYVPANVAGSAMRMAGMYVDETRLAETIAAFDVQLQALEADIEADAARRGIALKYSAAHGCSPPALIELFYGAHGYGLDVRGLTPTTQQPSLAGDDLAWYASIMHPRPDDNPIVYKHLKVKSLSKARSTHLLEYARLRRADGAIHPQSNWAKVRSGRLSMENPPVHGIPERSDLEVANAVKRVFVPRINAARHADEWDPRVHGSFFRWDAVGAEAVIRMAVLTYRSCHTRPLTLYEYLRHGKDVHSRTAGLVFDQPDGYYTKGTYERDVVGKILNFGLLYGGGPGTIQSTLWEKARVWADAATCQRYYDAFFGGNAELNELRELDLARFGETVNARAPLPGYCEDGYGKRRAVPLPSGVVYFDGTWSVPDDQRRAFDNACNIVCNTPTQNMCSANVLWALALCYHGEYVTLRTPPLWGGVVPYPEAKDWRIDGDDIRAWQVNTVHDSVWLDVGPGELERVAKVVARRAQAVPWDWSLAADVPLRVELKCGPDCATQYAYNDVAKRFGLEEIPWR